MLQKHENTVDLTINLDHVVKDAFQPKIQILIDLKQALTQDNLLLQNENEKLRNCFF